MAFERFGQKNTQVKVLFECLSIDGLTPLTGQAATITKALRTSGGAAAEAVAIAEQGGSGYYEATFTPLTGAATGHPYLLRIQEPVTAPSTTMERVLEYAIQVFDSISVTPIGGSYFTTLANVREFLGGGGTGEDALLANLIARATVEMQTWMDRALFQATFTEYYDGNAGPTVIVNERPIVSVTSLHDSLDQTWDATTVIAAADFAYDRNPSLRNTGQVYRRYGVPFYAGFQNVRVVYVGGYSTVPLDIEEVCIERVAQAFERRSSMTTASVSLGDGTRTFLGSPHFTKEQKERMGPYRRVA